MKRRFVLVAFGLVLALSPSSPVRAANSVEDEYAVIFETIQKADALNQTADSMAALAKFTEAQNALKKFRAAHPKWNRKIVDFRLNYVASKINLLKAAIPPDAGDLVQKDKADRALAEKTKPLPKNSDGISNSVVSLPEAEQTKRALADAVKKIAQQTEAINALARHNESLQRNMEQLQKRLDDLSSQIAAVGAASPELKAVEERLRQVEGEKTSLEAKLKEALAARPAALDSRELAKAEEKIRTLQKENQLLNASIEQRQAAILKGGGTSAPALEQLKKDLEAAKQKLAAQTEAASSWSLEKQAMQRRIQSMTDSASALATLRAENDSLKKRVDEAQSSSVTALQQAQKALDESNQKLARQVDLSNVLAKEKETLQHRLDSLPDIKQTAKELEEMRQKLATAQRKLEAQTEAAAVFSGEANKKLENQSQSLAALAREKDTFRAENDLLKKQTEVAQSKTVSDSSDADALKQKAMQAQAQLALLQSDKKTLQMEKTALEQQLKRKEPERGSSQTKPVAASAEELQKIKQLEMERDALRNKLQEATKGLNAHASAPSPKVEEMASQLASLRARLDVLEAKPIPYTPEEIALFKQPPTKLASKPSLRTAKDLSVNAKKLLSQAKTDFLNKDFQKAEEKYQEVLREDPQNLYVLANLASIQLESNKPDAAEENLKKALALDPNDTYSLTIFGNLKFRQKEYDAAMDALSRAAKLEPENAEVQNLLGITLSHKGMRGPAETALRKAIQIDPGFASAHNNLAVIYTSQEPPLMELARWHYQKALAVGGPPNAQLEKMLETAKSPTTNVKGSTGAPQE